MTVKRVVGTDRTVVRQGDRKLPTGKRRPSRARGAAAELSPQRVAAEARQRTAWDLRVAGATFDAIGRQMELGGANPAARAREMVEAYRTKVRSLDLGNVTAERELMSSRLDRMLVDLWAARVRRVADGTDPQGAAKFRQEVDVGVMPLILRVMERQARLLGLDAEDLRDDRRLELVAEQADSIARALDEALVELGVSDDIRARGRRLLAEKLRTIEGEAIRIGERSA